MRVFPTAAGTRSRAATALAKSLRPGATERPPSLLWDRTLRGAPAGAEAAQAAAARVVAPPGGASERGSPDGAQAPADSGNGSGSCLGPPVAARDAARILAALVAEDYEAVTPPTSEGSLTHPWACGSDALPSTLTSRLPSVGPVLLFTLILSLCSLTVPCVGQSAWLHLQAWPDPVFEGDALTLRCHGSTNKVLSQVKFYKDGKLLQTPKTRWSLSMGTATLESSGQYSCSGKVAYIPYLGRQTSELVKVQVQEPFPPPVLSAVPSPELREGSPLTLRCQTKLHPQKSASRLLFSFHRDASTLQDWGPHPELYLPGAQERDSGLYWCRATLEGGVAQKQSPQLEVRVQVPVSQPLLTLRPGPTGLTVGAMVELLCEAQKGSPPISYLFYLDGKILGNISSPYGRATCFPVTVTSERDARYSCRAENYVSGETSEPKILSLDGTSCPPAGL
ncbi:Fc receptor-like protein 6 [Lynx canadensis]|uniref:Fc receptor-like protein 6 n=1 Tax=Lynx canadensis TaxID=61383 RepID=UPI0013C4E475|nr:Fc receptor-like protein 6 [Lynx canadensis]